MDGALFWSQTKPRYKYCMPETIVATLVAAIRESSKFGDTIAKRAHSRKNEPVDCLKVFRGGHQRALVPEKFEHIKDVPEIASAIVDDTDAIGHGDL